MLRTLYAWSVIFTVGLFGLPWMTLFAATLPRSTTWRIGQALYRTTFALIGVHVRIEGLQQLNLDKPYVLVGNHVNLFDPFVLCCAFPRPMTGVEIRRNFKIPVYGWMMRRWGILPVTRGDTDQARKDLDAAREVLRRDRSWVVLFPEGTRTRSGALGAFKKGAAHLALAADVELVPFAQRGAVEVFRTGGWRLSPGLIEIRIAPVLKLAANENAGTLTERARVVVEELLGD